MVFVVGTPCWRDSSDKAFRLPAGSEQRDLCLSKDPSALPKGHPGKVVFGHPWPKTPRGGGGVGLRAIHGPRPTRTHPCVRPPSGADPPPPRHLAGAPTAARILRAEATATATATAIATPRHATALAMAMAMAMATA